MSRAPGGNCAESWSEQPFSSSTIEIALNRLRNRNCQNQKCANNKLNELNTSKWRSYHVKWVGRAAVRNCAKSLSEQQLSSPTIKIALSRFRNSNWLLIPPTPGPVIWKYRLITNVNHNLNELNAIKWKSYHVKWVSRAPGGNWTKSLSEQQLSSPTI